MQHYGKLDHCSFIGPMSTKKISAREKLLENNHKNVSRPKDFNKNTDKSNTDPPRATIARHRPKVNSVCFEDPYNHINPMENTHEDTHLIDTQEQDIGHVTVLGENVF